MQKSADDIVNHLVERIEKSSVTAEPYPHLSISQIFEDEVYNAIVNLFPKKQILEAPSSRLFNRYWSFIYPEPTFPQTWDDYGSTGSFWNVLGIILSDDKIKEALFKKFDKPLEETQCTARCVIDETGYWIKPHIDNKNKIVTMLLYTPEDDKHPHWGTSMYEKTVPFVKNQMFCFFNDAESDIPDGQTLTEEDGADGLPVHWVSEIKELEAERKQILVIWNKKTEDNKYQI